MKWTESGGLARGLRLGVALTVALLLAVLAPACGRERTPAEWLQECGRRAREYADSGGYLRFRQEMESTLQTERGDLVRNLRAEGEIILPDRERYEYWEEVRSGIGEGRSGSNSFSYITLDGGKTAYVKGERLSERLGVEGWVHYTPPEEENRFFDYLKLVDKVTATGREEQWLGFEEAEGVRCAHIAFELSGRDILELHAREGSPLMEVYRELDPKWLDEVLGVEVWISEEHLLPVRLRFSMRRALQGLSLSYTLWAVFEGYGEQPPFPIEGPAAFVEAR